MHPDAERAGNPEDLSRLIVERLNAGDVDGLVALYEPDAVLAPTGPPSNRAFSNPPSCRSSFTWFVVARVVDRATT